MAFFETSGVNGVNVREMFTKLLFDVVHHIKRTTLSDPVTDPAAEHGSESFNVQEEIGARRNPRKKEIKNRCRECERNY